MPPALLTLSRLTIAGILAVLLSVASGSDLGGVYRAEAQAIVAKLQGKRIVLVKDAFLNPAQQLTMLGWKLAQEFKTDLVNEGEKRQDTVIDRALGERLTLEEFRVRVKTMPAESVLARFEANYAIVGRYELHDSTLQFTTSAFRVPGAEVVAEKRMSVQLTGGYAAYLESLNREPAPDFTPPVLEFLFDQGRWTGAARSVEVVHLPDEMRNPGLLFAGDSFRIDVALNRDSCWLYVFGYDSTNRKVTVYFPNQCQPESRVTSRLVQIPPPGIRACLAVEPAGDNWVKAIACSEPVSCDFWIDSYVDETDPRILAFVRALQRKSSEGLQWDSRLLRFAIVRR